MSHKKQRILLIEDEAICLHQQKHLLEGAGLLVDTATSALEGLELLNASESQSPEDRYVAILIDLNLPDLNGDEVTHIVRETEQHDQRIPIIAVTAYATEKNVQLLKKKHISMVIEKPLIVEHVQDILSLIKRGERFF